MQKLGFLVLLAVVALNSACGQIQPWVKPYERERLADKVMAWDRDPIATSYITHVRENREGAHGGTGEAGGGCGCN
jgi:Domain of unknown function (DUF4266)